MTLRDANTGRFKTTPALRVTVTVDKRSMEAALERAKLRAYDALSWWVESAGERAGPIMKTAIEEETPVALGTLQLSTGFRLGYTRSRQEPGVRVTLVQTATNGPWKSGTLSPREIDDFRRLTAHGKHKRAAAILESVGGENLHYGQFLIAGFRVFVFGHDTGRYREPDDYPLRAYQNVYGDLREMLAYTGALSWSVRR